MNKFLLTAIVTILFTANIFAQSKTYFQSVAGKWQGTLEYLDYSDEKSRVSLKTLLEIKPSVDGNSAEVITIYDDFGKVMKDQDTEKIDLEAKKYFEGKTEYSIESVADGKLVLLGSGQDGEKVEPIRLTITFSADSLTILKETKTPWTFRHVYSFKKIADNSEPNKTLSVQQLQEDFVVLKKTLTTIHPGIYRYNTPESLEKDFAEYNGKLNREMPESEFFIMISQFLNKLKCGHTYTNFYNQNEKLKNRLFNRRNYFPFYFQIIDGKMIITENASSKKLSKGSEITKINGVAVKEIIEKLLTVTRADGNSTLEHRLNSIALPRFEAERFALFDWFFPLFFPFEDGIYTIEAFDFQKKKETKFQVLAMSKDERTAEMEKRYEAAPTYDDGWKFEIRDDSVGYLKIDNSITWRLKNIKFKEFLANAFAELRAKNVKNLVIDLRGNGGGDMEPGFELSRYLAQKTLPPYAESRRLVRNVSPQSELLKNLDTYSDELINQLKNGLPENAYKKQENGYFRILPNEKLENFPAVVPYENNFRGSAFIISDASNASATFQFLDYVKTYKLAKIVGQTTGGNKQGINGGNYFFLNLPNSKIEIDIPVYFQAPLKPQKDESIIPDVLVKKQTDDIGSNLDREFETIKQMLR